jgi:hypothetical protein
MVAAGNCRECLAPAASVDGGDAMVEVMAKAPLPLAAGGDEGFAGTPQPQELLKLQAELRERAGSAIPEEL